VGVLSFAISLPFLYVWLFVFFSFYNNHHYLVWENKELDVDPAHDRDDGATI